MSTASGHEMQEREALTSPEAIVRHLQFTQYVVKRNVGDVSHEESLRRFGPGDNSVYWILAHLVATRSRELAALGAEPVWSDAECRRFDRHAPPLGSAVEPLPLGELWKAFDQSHTRLVKAIGRLTPAYLSRPAPPELQDASVKTLEDVVVVLGFHSAYHAGQTGLLRRLLGKPPADL